MSGIAEVGPHNAVAAMPAHVEKGAHLPPAIAHEDHGVFAHIGMEKVIRFGDQAFMANHQPAAAKNLLQFFLIDIGICKDVPI